MSLSRITKTLCLILSVALLTAATALNVDRKTENWPGMPRRYWEDTYLAIGHRLTGLLGVSNLAWRGARDEDGRRIYVEARPTLTRLVAESDIEPWQPWRTFPTEKFRRRRDPPLAPGFDRGAAGLRWDPGRALLLSFGFGILGGVSPYLIFWLGFIAALPVLAWAWLELRGVGLAAAACVFVLLLALSPFTVELISLGYSALGFYLIDLVALAAVAAYALLSPRPTARGLLLRAAAGGLVFGICGLCRATTMLLAPGFALALAAGALRSRAVACPVGDRDGLPEDSGRPGLLSLALVLGTALALYAAPLVLATKHVDALGRHTLRERLGPNAVPPERHAFWHGVWMGLGDFDRTKGHIWDDREAYAAAERAGGFPNKTTHYDTRNEPILRRLVLDEIGSDPGWYAAILLKRLAATVTQAKLWPWGPRSGRSIAASSSPHEGVIDAYYSLVTPIDWIGVGARRLELPLPVLLLPTWVLLACALLFRWRGSPGVTASRLLRMCGVLGILASAALVHPVILTTASALEMQSIVVLYYLGTAFAAEEMVRWVRSRASRRPAVFVRGASSEHTGL